MTLNEIKREILATGYAQPVDVEEEVPENSQEGEGTEGTEGEITDDTILPDDTENTEGDGEEEEEKEKPITLDEIVLYATRRALRRLYSRREIIRTIRLCATGQQPAVYYKDIHCANGTTITLPLKGRAYSMRIYGEGIYQINDGTSQKIVHFNTGMEAQLVRGFIRNGGTIVFHGGTAFMVLDFSLYNEIYSTMGDFSPYCDSRVKFDIREIFGDFMSFIRPPTDGYGNVIEGALLYDGKLDIPSTFRGEVLLTYRTLPPTVTEDMDAVIAIPEEYSHLIPILAASYVWMEVDSEVASYYKRLFDDMLEESSANSYRQMDYTYGKGNGWI